jgi:hypothetical protein
MAVWTGVGIQMSVHANMHTNELYFLLDFHQLYGVQGPCGNSKKNNKAARREACVSFQWLKKRTMTWETKKKGTLSEIAWKLSTFLDLQRVLTLYE